VLVPNDGGSGGSLDRERLALERHSVRVAARGQHTRVESPEREQGGCAAEQPHTEARDRAPEPIGPEAPGKDQTARGAENPRHAINRLRRVASGDDPRSVGGRQSRADGLAEQERQDEERERCGD